MRAPDAHDVAPPQARLPQKREGDALARPEWPASAKRGFILGGPHSETLALLLRHLDAFGWILVDEPALEEPPKEPAKRLNEVPGRGWRRGALVASRRDVAAPPMTELGFPVRRFDALEDILALSLGRETERAPRLRFAIEGEPPREGSRSGTPALRRRLAGDRRLVLGPELGRAELANS